MEAMIETEAKCRKNHSENLRELRLDAPRTTLRLLNVELG